MEKITGVLRSEDINILGSVTNDSAEYGIVRMVVSNPSATVDALTKAGLLCHLTEVVGVELMDEVGNLNQLAPGTFREQYQCKLPVPFL